MRFTSSVTGISKIILILLLLFSFLVGALFSYIYTMGYYAPFEFLLPDKPVFSIQSVEFSKRDASFFDVTVVNPSYSQSDVNITRIEARTPDDSLIHQITSTVPRIPFLLLRGRSQTLRAFWNWANYTGIKILPYTDTPVEVRVFLEDRRGEIIELKRPLVSLAITELTFNQSISVNHFNVTMQNPGSSETYVNVTAFVIESYDVPADKVSPGLPYTLDPGDAPVRFQCFYNWTRFMNHSATITVRTHQGYIAQHTLALLPKPVALNITQTVFDAAADPQGFNITVANYVGSSTYVDIDRVTVAVGQQTPENLTWTAIPSSRLDTDASVLLVCSGWNWSTHAGQSAKITVYTSQGFIVSRETQIP